MTIVRADAALAARLGHDGERVVETAPGAVLSWPALHLLAEHGWRWRPAAAAGVAGAPVGDLLHVDLTVEHAPSPRTLLGPVSERFLAALGRRPSWSRYEGDAPLTAAALTEIAEHRSPAPTTFVVGGGADRGVGGLLVVERGPRSVFETLRVVVAIDDPGGLRDGLEAGLRSASLGRHPQSGLFSTSRGRVDGVTDAVLRGPVTPLAVFAGARALRARGLTASVAALGGRPVGPVRTPGALFWFDGAEPERWRAAADLAREVRGDGLRPDPVPGHDGGRTGEVR